jgi:hypothetical protein
MSSNEEEYNDTENPSGSLHGSKKRRIQRACDVCRRKKSASHLLEFKFFSDTCNDNLVVRCEVPKDSRLNIISLISARVGDGGQMPGNRCSNCIAYNFDCMYVEAAKVREIG